MKCSPPASIAVTRPLVRHRDPRGAPGSGRRFVHESRWQALFFIILPAYEMPDLDLKLTDAVERDTDCCLQAEYRRSGRLSALSSAVDSWWSVVSGHVMTVMGLALCIAAEGQSALVARGFGPRVAFRRCRDDPVRCPATASRVHLSSLSQVKSQRFL